MSRIGSKGPPPPNRRVRPRASSRPTRSRFGFRRAPAEMPDADEPDADDLDIAAVDVDNAAVDEQTAGLDPGDTAVAGAAADEPDADGAAWTEQDEPAERMVWARVGTALIIALSLGLLIVVGAELRDYLGRTQRFVVGEVVVAGDMRVSRDAIVEATGVAPGAALMSVSLRDVQARVEALPWVRRARARRELPNIIHVDIEEHVAVAILAGRPMWFVDHQGRLIKPVAAGEDDDLPLLTGVEPGLLPRLQPATHDRAAKRQPRAADAEREASERIARGALASLLEVQRAHEGHPVALRFPLSELSWDPVLGVTLISAHDGAELRIGRDLLADPALALTRLSRVLTRLASRDERLRYLLLDDPERPERGVLSSAPLGERTTGTVPYHEDPAPR